MSFELEHTITEIELNPVSFDHDLRDQCWQRYKLNLPAPEQFQLSNEHTEYQYQLRRAVVCVVLKQADTGNTFDVTVGITRSDHSEDRRAFLLVAQAIQAMKRTFSCFISYSSDDEEFASRLHADLEAHRVRCWFAPKDMKIGEKIRPTLDRSVQEHDKLLIILSENSIGSAWVEQEVETALARERQEDRIVLFPIRLDDTVMEIDEGWPALIRNTRHIGDFRNWKDHDAYQRAFGRLLRDLKAEGS